MKIKSFILLSDICNLISKYEYSLIFLKKALQYSWVLNDLDKESFLYERIGMLYNSIGDIAKANYYHYRSLGYVTESKKSPSRFSSEQEISKIEEVKSFYGLFSSINNVLLTRVGINLDEIQLDGNSLEELIKNCKFQYFSKHSVDFHIRSLFNEDKRMQFEIPSPRC